MNAGISSNENEGTNDQVLLEALLGFAARNSSMGIASLRFMAGQPSASKPFLQASERKPAALFSSHWIGI